MANIRANKCRWVVRAGRRKVAKQAEAIAPVRVFSVFPSSRKMANRFEKMGSFEILNGE
jgi:3-methyladenine DNA glycosylase AlkC